MEEKYKYYTGIGSRETPRPVLMKLEQIAILLCDVGYILRSGGAVGADAAFEKGVDGMRGPKRIYVPWQGYREKHRTDIYRIHKKAFVIAAFIHPKWSELTDTVKKFHARNIHQVLGTDLKTPSRFVVCWTSFGEPVGGTRTAIMLARNIHVPVYNLGLKEYENLTPKELVNIILEKDRNDAVCLSQSARS